MSNYAAIHQIVRGLLQRNVQPSNQLKELKRVWALVAADKNVQHPSLFVNILKVCSRIGNAALGTGETIHDHLAASTSKLLPRMSISPNSNVVIWNSLISMYTRCGAPSKALQLWLNRPHNILPDKFTMTCVLSACAAVGGNEGLQVGKQVHEQLALMPYSSWDEMLFTSLVNVYSKCDSPFDTIQLWLISHHFTMRTSTGTLHSFLKACALLGNDEALEIGRQIQQFARTLPESQVDMALHNAQMNMLVKCGDAAGAITLWNSLVSTNSSELNAQVATTALYACAQIGNEALEIGKSISQLMDSPQVQDPLYISALIHMYTKCGDVNDALIVWRAFAQRHVNPIPNLDVVCASAIGACATVEPRNDGIKLGEDIQQFAEAHGISPLGNLRVCNALMLLYTKCEASDATIELWEQLLKSQLQPNEHTYIAVLMACAVKGQVAYDMGKSICGNIKLSPAAGVRTIQNVYGAMVNMYGKCGSWEEAEHLFDWCCAQAKPSLSMCNAMVAAYGEHGQGSKARDLFGWMLENDTKPDTITFVNLLNAYTHSGLVDDALQIFESMKPKFSTIACLVDALGRRGLLEKAEELVNSIKDCDAVAYSALLSSCRLQRDVERAERVASKAMSVVKHGEQASTPYILLGNTYLATENFEKARDLSRQMDEKGLQRKYGRSTVVINGNAHTFGPNDRSHPHSNKIHAEIDRMEKQLMEDGYTHNTSWVMQDTNEEHKKHLLCRHSEKLALAYALLKTPPDNTLLRICGDCHDVTARISRLYNRTIVLRDTRRFHHFQDGKCSCGGVY